MRISRYIGVFEVKEIKCYTNGPLRRLLSQTIISLMYQVFVPYWSRKRRCFPAMKQK